MSKKDKENKVQEETSEPTELFTPYRDASTLPPPPAAAVPVVAKGLAIKPLVEKRITFDKYVARKGYKATHIPGLRAFAKNTTIQRTVAEWEVIFKNY